MRGRVLLASLVAALMAFGLFASNPAHADDPCSGDSASILICNILIAVVDNQIDQSIDTSSTAINVTVAPNRSVSTSNAENTNISLNFNVSDDNTLVNVNESSQNQTNEQTQNQTNTNTQETNVNASPIVITGGAFATGGSAFAHSGGAFAGGTGTFFSPGFGTFGHPGFGLIFTGTGFSHCVHGFTPMFIGGVWYPACNTHWP